MVTGALKARLNPRPARARSKQPRSGWSHAPRPGSLRSGSGTTSPSTLAKRRSCDCRATARQPTQVRSGSGLPDDVGVLALERLVGVEAAVARAGQRGVRAAAAVGEDRAAAAAELLLLAVAAGLLLLLGELGLGADVDAPAGEAGGEPGVLALAADRQRELVVGHDHRRLLVRVVDEHLTHPRGAEGLGHEPGRLVVVGDDVDLLAAQLGDDHAHARAGRPDAGADRIDAVGVRDDRDLRAVAGLAGDVGDLDQAVGDLGDLELEELLDQLGIAARDDDARPAGRGGDLLDHGLDPLRVVVALAVDLLGLGQQRLDALAQLHERVARVGLLDDAGDQLADAVAVLLEHHVALGLADPLQDHLLGGLRGDAPEVLGRDVALVDLVVVLLELGRVDLRVLRLDELAGLGVDVGALVDRLDDEVRLEPLGDDELDHAVVAGVRVHLHARVLRGAGLLLVGREQRVLERVEELVLRYPLLAREGVHGLDDLSRHVSDYSSTRFERMMSAYGIAITPVEAAIVTSSSEAPTSSPVKLLWPSRSSRVRTLARRPRKRRKCAGLESGRSRPGEETSRAERSRISASSCVTRSQSSRVTPSGWSMKTRTVCPPVTSASSTSTCGSAAARRASISA